MVSFWWALQVSISSPLWSGCGLPNSHFEDSTFDSLISGWILKARHCVEIDVGTSPHQAGSFSMLQVYAASLWSLFKGKSHALQPHRAHSSGRHSEFINLWRSYPEQNYKEFQSASTHALCCVGHSAKVSALGGDEQTQRKGEPRTILT